MNTIVDQLLLLDDEELTIPLPNGPLSLNHVVPQILNAELILDNIANTTNDDEERDPATVRDAQHSKYWNEWLAAMHEELEALKAKEVYKEVEELPSGRHTVQCKWVLRIKRNKDGQISRFKGRLVAKGFTQIFGQDFTFTFSPVAQWESIRSILCIAKLNNFELQHIDIKNAYLNAPLQEEIYMVAPDGCNSPYWHLRKGLYGLCQAKPAANGTFSCTTLTPRSGSPDANPTGACTFEKHPPPFTISATSVDDLLVASSSKAESDLTASQIKQKFAITDGGDTEWLLGCDIGKWRDRRLLMID